MSLYTKAYYQGAVFHKNHKGSCTNKSLELGPVVKGIDVIYSQMVIACLLLPKHLQIKTGSEHNVPLYLSYAF